MLQGEHGNPGLSGQSGTPGLKVFSLPTIIWVNIQSWWLKSKSYINIHTNMNEKILTIKQWDSSNSI